MLRWTAGHLHGGVFLQSRILFYKSSFLLVLRTIFFTMFTVAFWIGYGMGIKYEAQIPNHTRNGELLSL
jgi:hypothetical protein